MSSAEEYKHDETSDDDTIDTGLGGETIVQGQEYRIDFDPTDEQWPTILGEHAASRLLRAALDVGSSTKPVNSTVVQTVP